MTNAAALKKQPIQFGKYLLLDRINIGGMAEVWRGKTFGAGGFERLVAIKRILPNIAEDEEFISMFIDEAKLTVQLTHANIAQIYELGRIKHAQADAYFISMEYIPGKDLRAIFDRSRKKGEPAPVPLSCYVISKVCEGLDYAHRKKDGMGRDMNIVHRDVSPQNVLISYEGEVKLIDFGIAKAAGKATKTQAGILKGKFGYMSPEQIRGLPLDRRSDVFGVGVCLYEMLTGERLFVGDSDFSVLEKVRRAEVLPPSTYNRRVPEALEKVVMKALAKDVEERYQQATELGDELQRFLISSEAIFSRKDLAQYMKSTFAEEVEREKQRLQDYAKVKPPEGGTVAPVGPIPGGGEELFGPETPTTNPAPPPQPPPVPRKPAPGGGAMPKLTAAAPLLTGAGDDDRQATVLVDPNAPEPQQRAHAQRSPPVLARVGEGTDPGLPPVDETMPPVAPRLAPVVPLGDEVAPTAAMPVLQRVAPPPSPTATTMEEPIVARREAAPSRGGWASPLFLGLAAGGALVAAAIVAIVLFTRETHVLALQLDPAHRDIQSKVRVNIDGREIPVAELKWPLVQTIRGREALVVVSADGYEPYVEQVTFGRSEKVTRHRVVLQRQQGKVPLFVTVEPADAELRLDGETVKKLGIIGSYEGEVVAKVAHVLEGRAPGHTPGRLELAAGDVEGPQRRSLRLSPFEFLVVVTSEPPGAEVRSDGRKLGVTPANLKLPYGHAALSLLKPCYDEAPVELRFPPEPSKDPIRLPPVQLKRQPGCR